MNWRSSRFRSEQLKAVVLSFAIFFGTALGAVGTWVTSAHGDETVGEKIETKAEEIGKDAKKSGRKMKRKARNARGEGSVVKDAEDAAKNTGDSIEHGVKKTKRKID